MLETQFRAAAGCAALRSQIKALLLCAAGCALPLVSHALPVIPQGAGYGIDAVAGRGGVVHRVTNLNDSGPGSLRACLAASGPRVCVFEVSGTIRMTTDLPITNPYVTIAGQTAPSPGIMLRGAALRISASEVLVQHIRVRAGDDASGPAPSNRDALKIESPTLIQNIVVDHCSFSWAVDETATLWNAWNNVTLSNNIFSEGLYESILPDSAKGGYGVLVDATAGRVSMVGNLFAHNRDRNPLTRGQQFAFVNNVVYNQKSTAVDLQNKEGLATNNTIIGNVFIRGADTNSDATPVTVRTDEKLGLLSGTKIHLNDNAANETASGNDWAAVSAYSGTLSASLNTKTVPAWPAGLTRLPTDSNVVYEQVLRYSGARPADRDPVDARVVKSVRDRTGRVINCVAANGTTRCSKNAGGWPTLATNRRALTLPANHNEVTSSGYTRLELWLHEMAAEVEGRSPRTPSAPALASGR